MIETKINLQSSDNHRFDCYQFTADKKPIVGLIVIHEIFGLTEFIKNMCRMWAKKGYHVLAPALYDRIEKDLSIPYTEAGYKKALETKQKVLNWEQQLYDIEAAKKFLKEKEINKIIIMGYSWGGTLSWLAACRLTGISAAISYYGTHIYQFKDEIPRCPCLLHFADYDELVPPTHVDTIKRIHPSVDIVTYDATHGFRCEDWSGGNSQEYNPVASKAADQKTEEFILSIKEEPYLTSKL